MYLTHAFMFGLHFDWFGIVYKHDRGIGESAGKTFFKCQVSPYNRLTPMIIAVLQLFVTDLDGIWKKNIV